ncbi:hypothetical protein [Micromonospora sp. HM5-17]|jgi:hypothetical protein|uniref:hypothetical protein n=1 Tax=Micromonospora sp. HM5-17 TaxID=2487710 RepID=UPI000F4A7936|nr:hypothetical protein [Micromonospora sp. HM5-17]ROT25844.1 hypothetical protein EF879_26460 [Micromonospora sp. HM5-17]
MYRHRKLGAALTALLLSILLTACREEPAARPPTPAAPKGTVAGAGCPPDADYPPPAELPGITVDPRDSFWGLLFLRETPLRSGTEAKIVWRMTGSGTFEITATGPNGIVVDPLWGPDLHLGSTWTRPGDEWGTGWIFPTPGCWTVRAERSDGTVGTVALRVA